MCVHVNTCIVCKGKMGERPYVQSNLSILDTFEPNNTVLIMEVSLFQRFINTHLYCIGTDTTCPDYRGVLILECPQ